MPLAMNTFQSLRHLYFHVFELLIILNNNSERTALTYQVQKHSKCDYVDCLSFDYVDCLSLSVRNVCLKHFSIFFCQTLRTQRHWFTPTEHVRTVKLSGIVPSCTLLWLCCHIWSNHPTFNSIENITSQLNHTYAKRGIHNAFTSQ